MKTPQSPPSSIVRTLFFTAALFVQNRAIMAQVADCPPTISSQPANEPICAGDNVTFSVSASGTLLFYQWRKNGTNIPGATASVYQLSPAQLGDAGTYSVVVRASGCTIPSTSSNAVLTVNARPTAVISGNAAIRTGESAVIQASLTGMAPWNIGWSDGVTQLGVVSTPATRVVSPSTTTTYTVTTVV